MITTKHDLCAGTAKLNLNELIETAQIAVSFSRWECEKYLKEIQEKQSESISGENGKWRYTYRIADAAHYLEQTAKKLAKATNTLHYLLNAQDRDEIVVDRG